MRPTRSRTEPVTERLSGPALPTDLLAHPGGPTEDGLTAALRRRAADPAMGRAEVEVLDGAGQLIRSTVL
ncbi:hypothetical protein [Streptomyces sp. NPDC056683]|uniref:hypothetical protein n=1 Tax=Streptomyces sp. NPDC056683 TaxID=3345910 RepID=UPI0036908C4C